MDCEGARTSIRWGGTRFSLQVALRLAGIEPWFSDWSPPGREQRGSQNSFWKKRGKAEHGLGTSNGQPNLLKIERKKKAFGEESARHAIRPVIFSLVAHCSFAGFYSEKPLQNCVEWRRRRLVVHTSSGGLNGSSGHILNQPHENNTLRCEYHRGREILMQHN